jgi:GDP/UDP-N,N'-diacetylbacillosamine 2-epimerase (hydrolysing)
MKTWFACSSRADYGLIRPVLRAMANRAGDEVCVVCAGCAIHLEDKYFLDGLPDSVEVKRLQPHAHGHRLEHAWETAFACGHVSSGFAELIRREVDPPTWVFVPGDRFEIFAVTIAAYYCNQPIAHIFGGDRSVGGHLDDNVRHAITKLAHVHFAVCDDSYQRLLRMGEESWRVFNVGSPVVESAREVAQDCTFALDEIIRPRRYNILCTYHPVTTESESAGSQFRALLDACHKVQAQEDVAFIMTHPNNEVGSAAIVEELRRLSGDQGFFVFENLGWGGYLRTLSRCNAVVGNSSSGLLEAPILGVPTVDVGTRQKGRVSPPSVRHVESYDSDDLASNILQSLREPLRDFSHPYGNGASSREILRILTELSAQRSRKKILQKCIAY